jgi:hypothetical protein
MDKKIILPLGLIVVALFAQTSLSEPQYYDPFYLKTIKSISPYSVNSTLVSTINGKKELLEFDDKLCHYVMNVIEGARLAHKKIGLDITELKISGHHNLHTKVDALDNYLFIADQPIAHTILSFRKGQIKFISRTRVPLVSKVFYSMTGVTYALDKTQNAVLENFLTQQKDDDLISIDLTVIGDPKRFYRYYESCDVIKFIDAPQPKATASEPNSENEEAVDKHDQVALL